MDTNNPNQIADPQQNPQWPVNPAVPQAPPQAPVQPEAFAPQQPSAFPPQAPAQPDPFAPQQPNAFQPQAQPDPFAQQQPGAFPQQPGAYPQQPGAYPQQPGAYPQQPWGQQAPYTPPKKNKFPLWAIIGAGVLLVVIVAVLFLLPSRNTDPPVLEEEEVTTVDGEDKEDTGDTEQKEEEKTPGDDPDPIPNGDPVFVAELLGGEYGFYGRVKLESSNGGGEYDASYTAYNNMFAFKWGALHYIYKDGNSYWCDEYEMTYEKESSDRYFLDKAFSSMSRKSDGTMDLYGENLSYIKYNGSGLDILFFLKNGDVYAWQVEYKTQSGDVTLTCYVTSHSKQYMGDYFDHSRYTEE